MQFRADEGITDVEISNLDQCYTCLNESICPLIKCLQCSLVYPAQNELSIKFCDMYTKRLEVIQSAEIKEFINKTVEDN